MKHQPLDPRCALEMTRKFLSESEAILAKVEALEKERPNQLRVFEKFHASEGRFPTRDDFASQLVSKLEGHLDISLTGKEILDIGCRSGENAIAMQRAGANVIGIDPDSSEFDTARKKGCLVRNLYLDRLQDFRIKYPDKKFDIATVFLWNIPFKEREHFASDLKEVIHSNGCVIISYVDEVYDKDPEISVQNLMRLFFPRVERFEFPDSVNQYMLKCSSVP